MPVINMDISDLEKLVGPGFDLERFSAEIPMIGASVEKIQGSEISVEFFPDRPDLFCIEGAARSYRDLMSVKRGSHLEKFRIGGDSGIVLDVDPSLEGIRPVIGAAFITGVQIDEPTLISIMNLQEKLHITVGRKRRKVAIGIHDADPIKPPFKFWAAKPEEVEFVPLQKEGLWNLDRILKEHEKGVDYAWVLEGYDRYPIITDARDEVLSFPPIINGELTKVSEDTRSIFVDCTGWDLNAVSLSVNIVCSQLMERGGRLHSVKVEYPDDPYFKKMGLTTSSWPHFEWIRGELDLEWSAGWLGISPKADEIAGALKRMGYEKISFSGNRMECLIPPWRGDILHQADIAEDLAIGYGFQRFKGCSPATYMTGSERSITTLKRSLRESLVGLGFLEVTTISLSNEGSQFGLMDREEVEHLRIRNPTTTEHTMMRMSALPSLLGLLRSNKHRDLPQRIFEIADVMVENRNRVLISGTVMDNKASFTMIKGIVQKLLSDLELPYLLDKANIGCYIKGRGAGMFIEDQETGSTPFPELRENGLIPLGHFGEAHPRMLSEMELPAPVAAFELDLDLISKRSS
ncbi:MAG: phenylalanine--tRNA ligase subunit beta [Thermoplasmatota archaeon]